MTGNTEAGKNFGRVAWKARLRRRRRESPANSFGTGLSGRTDSEGMPDSKSNWPGERGRAVIVVNLLYPILPVYTYAVSDNEDGQISLIETLYNSSLLLESTSAKLAKQLFIYWEKHYEIQ